MIVAIVKENTIEQTGDLSVLFANVSFPPTGPEAEWMEENDLVPVTYWKPHDAATEKLVSVEPYIEGDAVFAVKVEPLTEDEIAARDQSQWAKVRADRNKRLAECDWWVTRATETNATISAEQQAYRQALRDITDQTNPFDINWPVAP